MGLKNILIDDEKILNTYKVNISKIDDLENLTGEEIKSFFNEIAINYVKEGKEFLAIPDKSNNLNNNENKVVEIFIKTISEEFESCKSRLDDIRKKYLEIEYLLKEEAKSK